MKFFALDGPFMEGMRKLADVILCNLLFLLCCIPIFTIGAALAALYQTMEISIVDTDDGFLFLDFFKAFRKHFKRATLTWILCLIAAGFLGIYYKVIGMLTGSLGKVYFVTFYVVLFLALFAFQYLFPMIIYRSESIWKTLKITITLSAACFPYTLLSILLLVISLVLSGMIFYQGGYAVVYVWLICGFGLLCYMNAMIFNRIVKRIGLESDNPDIAAPDDIDISQI